MVKLKEGFKELRDWLDTNLPSLGKLLIYLLVVGLSLVVIGTQRGQIEELCQARPVAVTVGVAVLCLLTGMLLAWRARDPKSWKSYRDVALTSLVMLGALGSGVYLIGAATVYADEAMKMVAARAATGWGLAYFAVGFLMGFLFGIPRVSQGLGNGGGAATEGEKGGAGVTSYEQRVNTNLVEISDWLTKIIVGLGLIELRAVPERIHRAAVWMGQSISDKPATEIESVASFCGAFIIFFSVVGFLAGYLLTRLYFSGAFSRADQQNDNPSVSSYAPNAVPGAVTGVGTQPEAASTDADRIRAYWKPNNTIDAKADAALKGWLKLKSINASVALFIGSRQYAEARAQAIKELSIQ